MEHTILTLKQVPAYEVAVHLYIKHMDGKRRLERFHKSLSNAACAKILLNQPLSLCVVEEGKRIVAIMELNKIRSNIMVVSVSSHTGVRNVVPSFFKKANELYPNTSWIGELNDFCNPVAFRLFRRYVTSIFAHGTDGFSERYCRGMNSALPVWSKDSHNALEMTKNLPILDETFAKRLVLANMAAAQTTWEINRVPKHVAQIHIYEIIQKAKEKGVQL